MQLQRTSEIASIVTTLVETYCSWSGNGAEVLLPRPNQSLAIHRELRDFADSAVMFIHASDWGTNGFPTKEQASHLSLFQMVNISDFPNFKPDQGFVSWLFSSRPGIYAVVINREAIAESSKQTGKITNEIIVRLFLHELGHLVLHGKQMFDSKKRSFAPATAPNQEEEAWVFVGLIHGIAAGAQAGRAGKSKVLDFSHGF